jgi:hypothetical protein
MTQTKPTNLNGLKEAALKSKEKEAYRQLHKTSTYRIGVGARADQSQSDVPSFFLEIIIKLSKENSELNLPRLERTLKFLKTLQTRGYSITCQDNNSVSCEIQTSNLEIHQEYTATKKLAEKQLE